MTTWHKWPKEEPPEAGMYLVTAVEAANRPPDVWMMEYADGWVKRATFVFDVVAWTEVPEPYGEKNE
jgi:hypothetical protein